MKIGWLIYKKEDASKNQSYITWFIEEAKQQNILLKLILREELLIGIDGRNYLHIMKINILIYLTFVLSVRLNLHYKHILLLKTYLVSIIIKHRLFVMINQLHILKSLNLVSLLLKHFIMNHIRKHLLFPIHLF